MKISDLIQGTYTSNEEQEVIKKIKTATPLVSFSERDQVIIEQLVRKSLVSKIKHGSTILVVNNGGNS